ncbi:MAG: aspartate carbamoyltransferase regulatory subunit [Lachnospiraceae bacterium]|nr:aspartate carbamoyltransferase regulatory subunit [Lachnospiraceae bacterium]
MLNIGGLQEGIVLDHIEAGKSMEIYKYLNLDKFDCAVAIIKNARSNKMGRKDIIKIECPIDAIDLEALGFIDHNITVNVIQNDKIVEKKRLSLPKSITNVVRCKNPRCITSIEQELDHVFMLTDAQKGVYRCKYCEEKYRPKKKKQI